MAVIKAVGRRQMTCIRWPGNMLPTYTRGDNRHDIANRTREMERASGRTVYMCVCLCVVVYLWMDGLCYVVAGECQKPGCCFLMCNRRTESVRLAVTTPRQSLSSLVVLRLCGGSTPSTIHASNNPHFSYVPTNSPFYQDIVLEYLKMKGNLPGEMLLLILYTYEGEA